MPHCFTTFAINRGFGKETRNIAMEPLTQEQAQLIETLARRANDLALTFAHEPDEKVDAAIAELRENMAKGLLQEGFAPSNAEDITNMFVRLAHIRRAEIEAGEMDVV
jgi:hypothetical protein